MKHWRSIWQCSLMLLGFQLSHGQVWINEVCANNQSYLSGPDKGSDYIELVNLGPLDVGLEGYYLTDQVDIPRKWPLPDVVIPSGGLLVLIADEQDLPLHTNFKISKDGEYIGLYHHDVAVDEVIVPSLAIDEAYGRNGYHDWTLMQPTPGTQNANFYDIKPITFSHESQVFTTDFTLTLTTNAEGEILYYTSKNQKFDQENTVYQQGIDIDTTCVICAFAKAPSGHLSAPQCHTFVKQNDHQLPSLSIIAGYDDFWSEARGLLVKGLHAAEEWPYYGANFWKDTMVQVDVHYFDNQALVIQTPAGFEMHGGRESRTNPMKTFRLLSVIDDIPAFQYPIFDTNPSINAYHRLVVRNASGDYNEGHCRDEFIQDYLGKSKAVDIDKNASQAVEVYINGQYYGLMYLREKIDKFYLQDHYQLTSGDFDLLEEDTMAIDGNVAKFRDDYHYCFTENIQDAAIWNEVSSRFDIPSFADYFIVQLGLNSTAWPHHNIKYWRKKSGGKWRYMLFDMDIAMARHSWTQADVNSYYDKFTIYQDTNVHMNLLARFLQNPTFSHYFFNRHQDLFNSLFAPTTFHQALQDFVATIRLAMATHFDRWPDQSFDTWESDRIEEMHQFIDQRPALAANFVNDFFELGGVGNVQISTNKPGQHFAINSLTNLSFPFQGLYFNDVPIKITLLDADNTFKYWQKSSNGDTTIIKSPEIIVEGQKEVKVEAVFDEKVDGGIRITGYQNQRLEFVTHSSMTNCKNVAIHDMMGKLLYSADEVQRQDGAPFEVGVELLPYVVFVLTAEINGTLYHAKFVVP